MKNTKNKLEALRDLKKRNSVPTCRFWFFRILLLLKIVDGVLKPRRVRRRGKPLVEEPYIETSAERTEQYRCKVKRAQPFRSASSDVCQAADQCNVDFQFLPCAPILEEDETAPDLAAASHAGASPAPAKQTVKSAPQWLGGVLWRSLSPARRNVVNSVSSAFRKMHAMDFYITKYQGKMMQSMTPLFAAMTQGIRKLEEQEKQAEELVDKDPVEKPARKKRKTKEDLQRLRSPSEMHSLKLHGEQMLLAFVRGNRCFRTHRRRLDRHAP